MRPLSRTRTTCGTSGRLAALLHKNAGPDYRRWPTAPEILQALTTGGAHAMGLEGEIGALRVGARADLILLDLSSPRTFR